MRSNLQRIAAGWCVLMVILLSAVQLTTSGPGMPPVLWLVFSAVWVFGAAMIWWFPTFGAVGTALYGVILGVQVLRAHGGEPTNWAIAIGSFFATVLAVAILVELRRRRGAP